MAKAKNSIPETFPEATVTTVSDVAGLLPVRVNKYSGILKTLATLKPNQAIKLAMGKSVDVRKVINNLTGAIINADLKAPEGHAFFKSVGKGNELVVRVLPRSPRKSRRANKSPAAK